MRRLTVAAVVVGCLFACHAGAAFAEFGPKWTVTGVSVPTNLPPGAANGQAAYVVRVSNTGSAASEGPVVITDELPEGLSLDGDGAFGVDLLAAAKASNAGKLECVLRMCTYDGVVPADDSLVVTFPVDVAMDAQSEVTNVVRVTGGGAASVTGETPTTISSTPANFGIAPGGASTALSNYQAAAHADLSTSIAFNTVAADGQLAADPKNTIDVLPPGFAGDLVDTPTCASTAFLNSECPVDTQVGITTIDLSGASQVTGAQLAPLYNLAPSAGYLAKLGFDVGGDFFYEGDVALRPSDYGLETTFYNATAGPVEIDNVGLTVWGVPSAAIHDPLRYKPGPKNLGALGSYGDTSEAALVPYLSSPTICTLGFEGIVASFKVDSWQEPERYAAAEMPFGPLFGCDRIGMEPSLRAEPTTVDAEAPTGFDVAMNVPQTYDNAEGVATSTLRDATVTLPEGMTVNPSAGAGLQGCSEAQYAEEAARYEAGKGCPQQSKLGSVRIVTPALKEEVTGSVFLAQPYANPFKSLIALYIVAQLPSRGILVRAAGEVSANPLTGRLVTSFKGLPPLPFSAFTLSFRQGETSPLVTPPTCGSFDVAAALTPYASPTVSLSALAPEFQITSGADGGACPAGVAPFAPTVIGGTNNNPAGSYSPFYLRIERKDGEQEITGFGTQLPPGLTGNLTGIEQCSEADVQRAREQSGAQAEAEPACPLGSEIGHTIAEAGVGTVLAQTPGKLYLGGPFEGAPFSLVSITSAKVGPFDLGTVVVHLPLRIDPTTAQVSVPTGVADQIPHIIDGIVVHLRTIRVYIAREHFIINPTSCEPMSLGATVVGSGASFASSADDQAVGATNRFQAADCASLGFTPAFSAQTSGKTSKADGTSLHVKITYPKNALGTQANIHEVKVELPRQLPVRQSTLPKACVAQQFDVNPAGCPSESIVGHAKAITPILPVALEGPAYFVSHGGAGFPDLDFVLQGDGVTIMLHGETFIGKNDIITTTFKTVPDQPVSSFELTLPKGPYSALTNNGDLCHVTKTITVKKKVRKKVNGHVKTVTRKLKRKIASKLVMPTTMIAQNGAELHQKTAIAVSECGRAKAKKAGHKHTHKRKHKAKHKHRG